MIIIPLKVDLLTDNEDINENEQCASWSLSFDVAGEIKIQKLPE